MDKKRPESLKGLNTIGKTGKISILFIIGFAIISLIAVLTINQINKSHQRKELSTSMIYNITNNEKITNTVDEITPYLKGDVKTFIIGSDRESLDDLRDNNKFSGKNQAVVMYFPLKDKIMRTVYFKNNNYIYSSFLINKSEYNKWLAFDKKQESYAKNRTKNLSNELIELDKKFNN